MDLISRAAVINKINERQRKLIYCFGFENDLVKIMDIAKSIVLAVPSEQPERERGTWKTAYLDHEAMGERPRIFYCSECNQCIAYPVNFCPSCGADMRGKS